jgi:hypothetical protein
MSETQNELKQRMEAVIAAAQQVLDKYNGDLMDEVEGAINQLDEAMALYEVVLSSERGSTE